MTLIDRDLQNARLLKPNIKIPATKPGIHEKWEGFEEWFCALVCAVGVWFVLWVLVQLWGWAVK